MKHFGMLETMSCDVLAGEQGPSCYSLKQLPSLKVIHVRFIDGKVQDALVEVLCEWRKRKIDDISEGEKINKFEKSINLWKSRSLSLIGKVMLINIIGLSKFFYLASISLLPDRVVHRVNQITWPFLWGLRLETVAPNTCYCRVNDGGLGLTNVILKCEARCTASLINTICNLEDKRFFLRKYFIGISCVCIRIGGACVITLRLVPFF